MMSAEKLETQNGIRNSRTFCQPLDGVDVSPAMLRRRATPTMALIPKELSQILGDGSKCVATVTRYQKR